DINLPLPPSETTRDPVPGRVVALPVRVLRPGVEAPVRDPDLAVGLAADEEGAVVARPGAVGRDAEEVDAAEIDAGTAEHAPRRPLHRRVVDQDADALAGDELADDLGVDPRDRRELPRPVAPLMRPGEPGRRVRLPLGRHAVAERGGGV